MGNETMETLIQDIRYGFRSLLKRPGFTAVAVLTLALGIGANTAIFSLLDAVLLRSLPVQSPERLVLFGKGEDQGLTNSFPDKSWDLFSYPFYQEMSRHNEIFADVGALLSINWNVHGTVNTNGASGEAQQLDVQLVSGTYFSVLGVNAILGRAITAADDQTLGGHPVTVVSYAWWERRMGSDPAAVGKSITIDQTTYTIIGVAPKEFFGTTVGHAPDIWVPLAMQEQLPPAHWNGRDEWSHQSLYLVARLRDGVSAKQANATVNQLFKQALQEQAGAQASTKHAQHIQQANIELTPLARGISELRREYSLSLRILMVVVGAVLLIACANVANLLLARAAAREKEFALRLALGAGRMRLLRQLFTESFLLAGLGAIAGVLFAWWGSRILVVMASSGPEPIPLDVAPNLRMLGFTLLALLCSVLIFGTAPALRAVRTELNSSLKSGKGSAPASSRSPLGKLLVVAQVALSLLLLVGAGLFVRTLVNLQNVPTGFNQQNVMLFELDTTLTGYKDPQLANLLRQVEEKVEAVPGVHSAAFSFLTFNQGGWTSSLFMRDLPPAEKDEHVVRQNVVGLDFFQAMGIPLVLGRGFGPQDTSKSQKVVVVSETMARRFFPNTSPLGKRFGTNAKSPDELEIVGVVKDAKYQSLTESSRPMVFYYRGQHEEVLNNLVVRFSAAPSAVVPQVRQVIREVRPSLPVDEVLSLSEKVGRSIGPQKLVARLASFFGLLALLLTFVGLFGVLSYAVTQRTPEIGIRMALGANRSNVLRLILRQGLLLTVIGIVLGLAGAFVLTKYLASLSTMLYGVRPTDPLTFAVTGLLLLVVASVACMLPARRATKVDPIVALREE